MKLQLKTKSGIDIEVEITGTQETLKIVMTPKKLKSFTVGGEGHIAASQKRTNPGVPMPADSLAFKVGNQTAFFQMDLTPVRAAIAALPKTIYLSRKVTETRNLDGDICTVEVWKIEGSRTTKNGYYIQDSVLGAFLDRESITEIETTKAVEMWSAKHETPEKLAARKIAEEKASRLAQYYADMEEMEA
jgi:hypothetical protein